MRINKRILSLLFSLVVVTSTAFVPLVAQSAATSTGHSQESSSQSSIDFSNSDTSTSDIGAVEASFTPATADIDPDGLESDYSIQRSMNNVQVRDVRVQNWNNVSGGAAIEAFIEGEVPENHYPFKYPVNITISAINSSGEVIEKRNTQLVLRPHHEQTDFSSINFDNFKESDLNAYSGYVSGNFALEQNNSTEYEFEVSAESQYNPANSDTVRNTFTVSGSNTNQRSNISGLIQTSDDFRYLTTQSRANSYRASDTGEGYLEDASLPVSSGGSLSGDIVEFDNMTNPDKTSATIQSEAGNLQVTTATEFVEPNSPQTLVIRSTLTGKSDSITITPISADGSEIDENTSYELRRSNQTSCIDGNVTSVCIFDLSGSERDYINQHGELFLSYESGSSAEAEILCQSVIGGGINTDATDVCGIKTVSEDIKPVYNPLITELTLYESGTTNKLAEESPISLAERDPSNFDIGLTVKNGGTAPLEANEPVQVFEADSFTDPSTNTIAKSPSGNSDTLNYNLSSNYPTSNITVDITGQSNSGTIELKLEDDNGDSVYKTFDDLGGTNSINLTELGGYTQGITAQVELSSDPTSEDPKVDEIKVTATDQGSQAEAQLNLNNFSGGSGSLAPGSTRTHIFDSSSLDLTSLLNPATTIRAEMGTDQEQLIVKTDNKLVADAGGPYTINMDVNSWEREQVGYGTIVASDKPGPEWKKQGEYTGNLSDLSDSSGSDVIEITTEHKDLPKLNVSNSRAVQYYKDNEYVNQIRDQLPENYASEASIKGIRYTTYKGEEYFYGTEQELEDNTSLTYNQGNWSSQGFQGEDVEGYNIENSTIVQNSDGDLEFDTDNSDAIYFYGSGSKKLIETELQTIEQGTKPETAYNAPKCSNTSNYPCWEKGEYIDTKRQTDGFSDQQCQTVSGGVYDPGPDWYYDKEDSSMSVVCWEKVNVTSETDIYEWTLLDQKSQTQLDIPNTKAYQEYTRPKYDAEIVWGVSRDTTQTQYEWNGPVYDITANVDNTTLNVNAIGTQIKSTVPIEEWKWSLDGKEVGSSSDGTSLTTPQITISELGEHKLKLEVIGGGMRDSDTTTIDAISSCSGITFCEGGDHPNLTIGRVTQKVDYVNQEAAIEANLSETPNNTDRYQYRLRISPAESQLYVSANSDSCPVVYNTVSYTLPSESGSVPNSEAVNVNGGSESVDVCEATERAPDGGPDKFLHPKEIDDESVLDGDGLSFTLNQSESKVFWSGSGIPDGGLKTLAYINPRLLSGDNLGNQEFTVELEMKDTAESSPSYSTIDQKTAVVEFCKANTEFECESLDSDGDGATDGGGGGSPLDECPYRVGKEEKPCDTGDVTIVNTEVGADEAALKYGFSDNGGWNIEIPSPIVINDPDPIGPNNTSQFTTDTNFIGIEPSYSSGKNPFNSSTIEMYYDNNDTVGHWPLNDTTEDASRDDLWKNVREIQGDDAKVFPEYGTGDVPSGRKYVSIYNDSGGKIAEFTKVQVNKWNSQSAAEIVSRPLGTFFVVPKENTSLDYDIERQIETKTMQGDASKYTYEVNEVLTSKLDYGQNSPIGNSYSVSPKTHIAFANHDGNPNNSIGDTIVNNNLSFSISFWYKPDFDSTRTEQAIFRNTDANSHPSRTDSGSVLVATTDGLSGTDKNVLPDNKIKESELKFGEFTVGGSLDDTDRKTLNADNATNRIQTVDAGKTVKYLLYDDLDGSDKDVIIQWWIAENDVSAYSDYFNPQSVDGSDYYVKEYTPSGNNEQIVMQVVHKKADTVAELAYVNKANDAFPDNNAATVTKYIDGNSATVSTISDGSNTYNNKNEFMVASQYPFLLFRGKNQERAIVDRGSNTRWRNPKISVIRPSDSGGATSGGELRYTDNISGDTVGPLNLPASLASDIYGGSSRLQIFAGAGWQKPSDLGYNRQWGGQFSGKFSDVAITQYPTDTYTTSAHIATSTRAVPDSKITNAQNTSTIDISDVTFTKGNIRMKESLSKTDSANLEATTSVTITAVPTKDMSGDIGNPSPTEYFQKTYIYSEGASWYTLDTFNGLASGTNYTDFKLQMEVDTIGSQEGWMSPQIQNVELRNYSESSPVQPPQPTELSVATTGPNGSLTDNKVYAPAGSDQSGGAVNLTGTLGYKGPDLEVPIRFRVRDNNTTLYEGTISTGDSLKASDELSWRELQEKGITPRSDPYLVEFVVTEKTSGEIQWEQSSIGGTEAEFIVCDESGSNC